ncbi:MAG: anaerobic ribonucleoside-triphosphate reductase activating protein, partial [Patescibacteria group bacterium]|nr:anaerobic ribonucleoside-triphosphate reductase activating protein [Patescibacteria group bacterium]
MIEIGGLQKSTLIDYSGKIACTVFLVGCNLRCPWCHSPEIVLPDLITKQPIMEKQDFFSFLDSRKGLLDGVVVCGGEPTINKDLPEFIGEIKERGFSVKLDTNGTNPSMIRSLLDKKLIDYIAMDLKAPIDKKSYSLAVGVDLDTLAISESVKLIKESGIDYEFRTTVVPGIHG